MQLTTPILLMVVITLSDYIVDEDTRNKLDEARYSLATHQGNSGNTDDRTLYSLALVTGNFLAQAILTLPDLSLDENGLPDDEGAENVEDEEDNTGSFIGGISADEVDAFVDAMTGGSGTEGD